MASDHRIRPYASYVGIEWPGGLDHDPVLTVLLLAMLLAAGNGIALLPLFLASPMVREGKLRPVVEDWRTPDVPFYSVMPPGRGAVPAVRAIINGLRGEKMPGLQQRAAHSAACCFSRSAMVRPRLSRELLKEWLEMRLAEPEQPVRFRPYRPTAVIGGAAKRPPFQDGLLQLKSVLTLLAREPVNVEYHPVAPIN